MFYLKWAPNLDVSMLLVPSHVCDQYRLEYNPLALDDIVRLQQQYLQMMSALILLKPVSSLVIPTGKRHSSYLFEAIQMSFDHGLENHLKINFPLWKISLTG